MVLRILAFLGLALILLFIAVWVSGGASQDIALRANEFSNPVRAYLTGTSTESSFRLPSYRIPDFPTIDINDAFATPIISSDPRSGSLEEHAIRNQLLDVESEYDRLADEVNDVREFGNPSPRVGDVSIVSFSSTPTVVVAEDEYITLRVSTNLSSPINLTGWSVQSLVTGTRVYVPQGVRTFKMGSTGALSDVYAGSGASVVITSGASPVGVSIRENSCSGYLDQFQPFTPSFSNSCPAPSEELPATAESYQTYGVACVDFVHNLNRCEYYTGTFTAELSNACRAFVRSALTYNGCVERNQWRPSFSNGSWRVFIGSGRELWRNDHDILRLLDESGRTVDVWSY